MVLEAEKQQEDECTLNQRRLELLKKRGQVMVADIDRKRRSNHRLDGMWSFERRP